MMPLLLLLVACNDPGTAPTVVPEQAYPPDQVHLLGTLYFEGRGAQVWRIDDGPRACYILWSERVIPMGCVQ